MNLARKKSKLLKKINLTTMEKLNAEIKDGSYENIIVDCPHCGEELIFNRISDLGTVAPVAGKNLKCENCEKVFWAKGDRVTSAKYRWFLDDLSFLKKNKKYGLYIFTLCQACETFMHQAIINKRLDTNQAYRDSEGYFCGENKDGKYVDYNEIYKKFCNKKICEISNCKLKDTTKYRKSTFLNLKDLFICIFDHERKNKLPTLKKLEENKRAKSFCVIKNTDINQTRNKIVHKNAHRPSFCDIQKYDDLISGLYWLGMYLDVKDSLFYINKKITPTSTLV